MTAHLSKYFLAAVLLTSSLANSADFSAEQMENRKPTNKIINIIYYFDLRYGAFLHAEAEEALDLLSQGISPNMWLAMIMPLMTKDQKARTLRKKVDKLYAFQEAEFNLVDKMLKARGKDVEFGELGELSSAEQEIKVNFSGPGKRRLHTFTIEIIYKPLPDIIENTLNEDVVRIIGPKLTGEYNKFMKEFRQMELEYLNFAHEYSDKLGLSHEGILTVINDPTYLDIAKAARILSHNLWLIIYNHRDLFMKIETKKKKHNYIEEKNAFDDWRFSLPFAVKAKETKQY